MTKDEILALGGLGLWEAVSHIMSQHPKDVMWRTADTTGRIIGFMETQDVQFELSNVIPNSDPIVYECSFSGARGRSYACEFSIPIAVQRAFVLYMNDCFETHSPFPKSDCEHFNTVTINFDKEDEKKFIELLKRKPMSAKEFMENKTNGIVGDSDKS
jgi:hypothetical protein